MSESFIHPTVEIEKNVSIGANAKIWQYCHLREGATLDSDVSLGRNVFLDKGVSLGKGSRVQNGVSIYAGVHIADWCFIGPHVVFTNDQHPRAGVTSWSITETFLETGAAIGAGAVIRCGLRIGAFAMVGAGAVVTKSIPPFHLAIGFPAESMHMICACGESVLPLQSSKNELIRNCCNKKLKVEVLLRAKMICSSLR